MVEDALAAVLDRLTGGEVTCLAGVGISPEMLLDGDVMEAVSSEVRGQALGCLDDDTVADIFFSRIVGDLRELTPETNVCVRSGMEAVDLRGVMAAGPDGDEQEAVTAGMSVLLLTVSCLNDEELAEAGLALGIMPEDREGFLCVIDELGGPEGFAGLFEAEDESGLTALFGASMKCGMGMGGAAPGG